MILLNYTQLKYERQYGKKQDVSTLIWTLQMLIIQIVNVLVLSNSVSVR